MQEQYYLKKIKEDFSRRTRVNSSYSLRAYARYLNIHPSTLSQVLLGKRPLPQKSITTILEKLRLNATERSQFKKSLLVKKSRLDALKIYFVDESHLVDEAAFQVIAEWEHYAVLTLFDCAGFHPTIKNIQDRLNITRTRTEVVISNLIRYGLLIQDGKGELSKSHPRVRTSEDVASQALKQSHLEALDMGKQKLFDVDLELRDFSSVMMAIDPSQIPEAKNIIREFRKKMLKLCDDGLKTEVYQMAIQFYPLTQIKTHLKESK